MSEQVAATRASYAPGDWLVLSSETALVVLQPASGQWSALIQSIWEAVVAATSAEDLTTRLSSFGLDDMPSFASFFWGEEGLSSVIRGDVRATNVGTGQLIAPGALSWGTVSLPQLRIEMQPYEGPQPPLELPVLVGAASASSVVIDTAARFAASQPPAPFAAMEPEPPAPSAPVYPVAPAVPPAQAEDTGPDTEIFFPDLGQPAEEGVESGALVFAVRCQIGHPNPPEARACRLCFGPIAPQNPQQIPRPVLAVLLPSTSGPVEVDRPVLIGRSPSTSRSESEQLPWLLTVPSPSHDISRTHLEITPEGWSLRATDLNSTNGTVLIRPNSAPERMPAGQPVEVSPGCVLDLGDGVTIAIDNPQG